MNTPSITIIFNLQFNKKLCTINYCVLNFDKFKPLSILAYDKRSRKSSEGMCVKVTN